MILNYSPVQKTKINKMTSYKILIVEDEILIADNLKHFLNKNGHDVIGMAISYDEAIEIYKEEEPDIVLLDIRINGNKTGIDIAHFIRNQENPVPFIFLTSQIDIENINEVKKTLPAGYLSKPVQKESLFASLEIAMHQHLKGNENVKTIPLYDGNTNHMIPIDKILYIESEHVYVKVYIENRNYLIQRSSMKELLTYLPENQFLQTHRSFAVNTEKISHWDFENIYINDKIIPISRSRRKEVGIYFKTV